MATEVRRVLMDPLIHNNPIALQVLGICSALAVTTNMQTSVVMSAAVVAVTALSNLSVSLPPQPHSDQHPDHRPAHHHRLAGHRHRPDPEGVRL